MNHRNEWKWIKIAQNDSKLTKQKQIDQNESSKGTEMYQNQQAECAKIIQNQRN